MSVGISGPLLNWFIDYLTGRKQRVVLEGSSSSVVDWGSNLELLLFSISIAGISLSKHARVILYADDILLYKPVNSTEDINNLQAT